MLNFAVEGKLTLSGKDISGKIVKNTTVILDDMVLAQGHTAGGRNNWWIGGAHCKLYSVGFIACESEASETSQGYKKTTVCFERPQNHVSTIRISVCSVKK